MNDLAPIFRRVANINPVPDETDIPDNAMATTTLLEVIDERTGTLQTHQSEQTDTNRPQRPKQRTGMLLAFAAFAVVIVVGGLVAFTGTRADDTASANPASEVIPLEDLVSRFAPANMENTIQKGALVTVDRSAYDSEMPQRLDIVIYAATYVSDIGEPRETISRVIGLPGDTIEQREGILYVNGTAPDEPYVKNPQITVGLFDPVTLGADEFWLIGDNRQASGDSRNMKPVAVSLIRGEVTNISNP